MKDTPFAQFPDMSKADDSQSIREQVAFFANYLKPHKKLFFFAVFCSMLYGAAGGAALPLCVQYVFKNIFETSPTVYSTWQIIGIASILPGIFIFIAVFGFLGAYLMTVLGLRVSVNIKQDLFEKLQTMSLSFFSKKSTGDMLTRIHIDAGKMQFAILEVAGECIRQPIQALFALSVLIYYSIENSEIAFILLFFAGIPFMLLPVRLIAKKLRHRGMQIQESTSNMTQQMTENFGALVEVRAFGMEKAQSEAFHKTNKEVALYTLKQKKYERIQQPASELIISTVVAASFVYCYKKGVGFDVFFVLGIALFKLFDPIKRVMKMISFYNQNEPSIYRVQEILNIEPDIRDEPHAKPIERVTGNIDFNNVTFAYDADPVLKGINIHVPAEKVCALVGPSGAGKSTFANLIPRFYDPIDGAITLDGHNIKDVTLKSLRENMAIVSQSPVLFNDTITSNIRHGKPGSSDEEVIQAAKMAYAHDFIEALPHGYDTLAGERGGHLSGGQRQRIALARAFLKNAPILILDEATSALDSESEHYIQLAIKELTRGKTVIIIAHRLSTIKQADMICVFDQGRIVDTGKHSELIESSNLYKMLCQRQSLE